MTPRRVISIALLGVAVLVTAVFVFQPQWLVRLQLQTRGIRLFTPEDEMLDKTVFAELNYSGANKISERSVEQLTKLKFVQGISVIDPPPGYSLEFIDRMPNVVHLSLYVDNDFMSRADAPAILINSMTDYGKIESLLILRKSGIPTSDLQAAKKFPRLRYIALFGNTEDESIVALSEIYSVETVRITPFELTPIKREAFTRMPNLTCLQINGIEYTGNALKEYLKQPPAIPPQPSK